MKATKLEKFDTQASSLVTGSSFSGIIITEKLETLLDRFGKPTMAGESGDEKIQLEWIFQTGKDAVITVYDWKEECNIYQVENWHIGNKNTDQDLIEEWLDENDIEYVLDK